MSFMYDKVIQRVGINVFRIPVRIFSTVLINDLPYLVRKFLSVDLSISLHEQLRGE